MNVFFSTMLYALGKQHGVAGAAAEFARQCDKPDIYSLNVVRTLGRLLTLGDVGVYTDNTATCIAKGRSRAFHAAHASGADVWISCDDDVECTRATLELLLAAAHVLPGPRVVFVPTTLRGNESMASVKWAPPPKRREELYSFKPIDWEPVTECGAGLFAVNRAALDLLAHSFDHLQFRDHDGVVKLGLFVETIDGREWVGEDIAFCRRAALVGCELVGLTRGNSRHGDAAPLDLWTIRPTVLA